MMENNEYFDNRDGLTFDEYMKDFTMDGLEEMTSKHHGVSIEDMTIIRKVMGFYATGGLLSGDRLGIYFENWFQIVAMFKRYDLLKEQLNDGKESL